MAGKKYAKGCRNWPRTCPRLPPEVSLLVNRVMAVDPLVQPGRGRDSDSLGVVLEALASVACLGDVAVRALTKGKASTAP